MPASTESGWPPATTPRRPRTTGRNVSAWEIRKVAPNTASEVAIERKQRNRRWFIILDKPPSQADLKEFYSSSVPESTKTNRGMCILRMIHGRDARAARLHFLETPSQ